MLSAGKARRKAQESIRNMITEDMIKVEAAINEAIEKGEFEAKLEGTISSNTKRMLEELGYKVTEVGHYNEFGVFIKF